MKYFFQTTAVFTCFFSLLAAQEISPQNAKEVSKPNGSLNESEGKNIKHAAPASPDPSPHFFTGVVTFVSDYRSRGISDAMRRPAVQGEMKYEFQNFFYFKTWGSNVDGTTHFLNNTSLEWDFFIGLKNQIFSTTIQYDTGLIYYYYPGGRAFVKKRILYDTIEFYVGLNYKIISAKISLTLSDFYGNNSNNPPMNWEKRHVVRPNGHSYFSPYFEINLKQEFIPTWFWQAHVGYQGVTNYPVLNYFDWQLTLIKKFNWFDLSISYLGTNGRDDFYTIPDHSYHEKWVPLAAPGFVVGVSRTL